MYIPSVIFTVFVYIFSFCGTYGSFKNCTNTSIGFCDDTFLLRYIGNDYNDKISDEFKSSLNGELAEAISAYSDDISKIIYRRGSCGALIITFGSRETVVVKPMFGQDILMNLDIYDRVKKSEYIKSFGFINYVYINKKFHNILDNSFDRTSIKKDARYITFQPYINGITGKKTIINKIISFEYIFSKLSDIIIFMIKNGICLKDLHGYNWLYNKDSDKIYLIDFDARRIVLDDCIENAIDGYLTKVCRTLTSIELTKNNNVGTFPQYSDDLFVSVEIFLKEFLNSAMKNDSKLYNIIKNRLNRFLYVDDLNSKIPIFGKDKNHFKMYFKHIFSQNLFVDFYKNHFRGENNIIDKLRSSLNNIMCMYEKEELCSSHCPSINAEINWLSKFGINEYELNKISNSHPFYVVYWLVYNIERLRIPEGNVDLSSCYHRCHDYFLKKIIRKVLLEFP